jgi:hypothetical protein
VRRLILPLFLVLCSSGCGGCLGDDNSSSGRNQKPIDNPGAVRPGAIHVPLRPITPGMMPTGSAVPPASAPTAAPSVAPPTAPSGSAVP